MNTHQMNNEDILNECLEAVLRGESEESCLARYPQQASDLSPLLKTVMAAREACRIEPRPEYRARARYEYRRAVADACVKQAGRSFRWSWRWSTAIPLAVAVMMMSGGGVLAASAGSIPGQPLYEVKLAMEQVQVNLTPSEDGKTKVYAALAERRVDEIIALTDNGSSSLAGETSLRLEDTLNKITGSINVGGAERNSITMLSPEAYPPVAMATETFGIKGGPEMDAAADAAVVDPELLGLLKEYAARDREKLQALMGRLPDNTRVILQHAIDSYEAILNAQPALD